MYGHFMIGILLQNHVYNKSGITELSKIYVLIYVEYEGYFIFSVDSKVTAILLDAWILPVS